MKTKQLFNQGLIVLMPFILFVMSLHLAPQGYTADLEAALFKAAEEGDVSNVGRLIREGANVNASNEKGIRILTAAVASGHTEIVKMLLEKGANLEDGKPLLMVPVSQNNLNMVRTLVTGGADVNARFQLEGEWKNWTPLMLATSLSSGEIVEVLLNSEAEVNAIADGGITALLIAAGNNRQKIVKLLLAHGADPNIKDQTGATPLDYARRAGHEDVVKMLEQRNEKVRQ